MLNKLVFLDGYQKGKVKALVLMTLLFHRCDSGKQVYHVFFCYQSTASDLNRKSIKLCFNKM